MEHEHKWEVENMKITLPDGWLIHAIVVCFGCMTIKEPLKVGEFSVENSPTWKARISEEL